ncbi:S-Ena type endospore appendage [Bacillus sp. FJAT-45037]|uniref:S-Ena type endospore appendage n=1 Tax=Bacillus sp. FJAT-45037 TaxID=2011007 RepID=UPI003FA4821C
MPNILNLSGYVSLLSGDEYVQVQLLNSAEDLIQTLVLNPGSTISFTTRNVALIQIVLEQD